MQIGIMQPYFFPNAAHFALIAACERWVVFDISQFTRKTWMTRNRMLHPSKGWFYINVPVENAPLETPTCSIRVKDIQASKVSMLGKLTHYRRKAPFYSEVTGLVAECFKRIDDNRLVSLNTSSLQTVMEYLELPFNHSLCSELALTFPTDMGAGDWAPLISRQLGATSYINPAGGRHLFQPEDFKRYGIRLGFSHFEDFSYSTRDLVFEPGLSILDALMWNPPESVAEVLKGHHHIEFV